MTKWIMSIAVVAVVAGGLYWYFVTRPGSQSTVATNQQASTTTQTQNGMSAPNDTSDQALAQDAAAIDAQMQGLSQDSAAADASLSDQPVSQSY